MYLSTRLFPSPSSTTQNAVLIHGIPLPVSITFDCKINCVLLPPKLGPTRVHDTVAFKSLVSDVTLQSLNGLPFLQSSTLTNFNRQNVVQQEAYYLRERR